jgi:hypothetical protein
VEVPLSAGEIVCVSNGVEYAAIVHLTLSYGVDVEHAYWCQDSSGSSYAGGVALTAGAGDWTVNSGADFLIKVRILDSTTTLSYHLSSDSFSVCMWIKKNWSFNNVNQYILELYGLLSQRIYLSRIDTYTVQALEFHREKIGTEDTYVHYDHSFCYTNDADFHCYILTCDVASNVIKMYRDGVEIGTRSGTAVMTAFNVSCNMTMNKVYLCKGSIYITFPANMAHISLWDGVLSAADISLLSSNAGDL